MIDMRPIPSFEEIKKREEIKYFSQFDNFEIDCGVWADYWAIGINSDGRYKIEYFDNLVFAKKRVKYFKALLGINDTIKINEKPSFKFSSTPSEDKSKKYVFPTFREEPVDINNIKYSPGLSPGDKVSMLYFND